jgi:putative addiction module component (TIGR02574 family)
MYATAEQVLKEALGLPPVDRAELIERLFQSFDPSADRRADEAWSREVESRIDAYESGKITASPAEEVLARINRR